MLFVYLTRRFSNEEYSFCLCTSRSVFRTRSTLVVWALHAEILERGVLFLSVHFTQCFQNEEYSCCLCTSRIVFQTRNTLIVCALYAVFLERGILLLFVHFTRNFQNEEYSCCLCTPRNAFRTRNTLVVCAPHAVLLKRGIILKDRLVCALRAVVLCGKNLNIDIHGQTAQPHTRFVSMVSVMNIHGSTNCMTRTNRRTTIRAQRCEVKNCQSPQ